MGVFNGKVKNQEAFELLPENIYDVTLAAVGVNFDVEVTPFGKPDERDLQNQATLYFVIDAGNQPTVKVWAKKISLNERASFREILEHLDKALTPSGKEKIDVLDEFINNLDTHLMESYIGKACDAEIGHKPGKDGKVYLNIVNLQKSRAPKPVDVSKYRLKDSVEAEYDYVFYQNDFVCNMDEAAAELPSE